MNGVSRIRGIDRRRSVDRGERAFGLLERHGDVAGGEPAVRELRRARIQGKAGTAGAGPVAGAHQARYLA
jgi:hypothetical protein